MAVRHRLIRTRPEVVWDVLADGVKYPEWVVGPSAAQPVRGRWPHKDAAIRYAVPIGPVRLSNETVVRRCEEGVSLELEAHAGPLGTARIAIEVKPWGEHTLVVVDEHPLRGAGGFLHNAGFEVLIQLRHRAMLARLARLCESRDDPGPGPAARTAGASAGRAGSGHA